MLNFNEVIINIVFDRKYAQLDVDAILKATIMTEFIEFAHFTVGSCEL